MSPDSDLTGKILIAMPEMGDPRFARSVVLVCAYSDEGAMGIVLNQPAQGLDFPQMLDMLGIDAVEDTSGLPIRIGGPVESARGFILHSVTDATKAAAMNVGSGLLLSTTRDILVDLAAGRGPDRAMLVLGYAGWAAGQLDTEIRSNGWLIGEMDPDLAFGNADKVWSQALHAIGVNPLVLSGDAGHA